MNNIFGVEIYWENKMKIGITGVAVMIGSHLSEKKLILDLGELTGTGSPFKILNHKVIS